ncbi:MAG: divergent polysaccharide deacetylase family protein [Wolinella sp.]
MPNRKRVSTARKERAPRSTGKNQATKSKIGRGVIIAIALSALLIGIFGGYALFNALSSKESPVKKIESNTKQPNIATKTPEKRIVQKPNDTSITNDKNTTIHTQQLIDKNLAILEQLANNTLLSKDKNDTKTGQSTNMETKPHENQTTTATQSPLIKQEHPKTLHEPQTLKAKQTHTGSKPKLAIIIDDVGFKKHADGIKNLPFKVTPAIFPPGRFNPQSHKLAENFDFYMVHLPLEAHGFYQKEHEWLRPSDSLDKINARIEAIKRDFPRLQYINNHTGSKFTEDSEAMRRLLTVLDRSGIHFVDSRTTPNTKAPQVANELRIEILSRDIFLDNQRSIPYIKKQLAEAIRIAKKRGYAIAIGHPHDETLRALRESNALFSDVELVYINELW